jgi:hypothetical protein
MRRLLIALAITATVPALAQDRARAPLHLTEREAARLVGLRVELRDLRLGSPAFGRGIDPVLLADPGWFAVQQADARRIAPQEETGLPPEAFEAWAARRDNDRARGRA